ncbi:Siroheme biosynthesis protein met8 [Psilocybe cubensis]|uniref:Siroheme biosynthesis protein met8 n=2 Tax=Psilocybe cubensis TaxID=181762 RepID=A0ACB8H8X4_PSICU|nr:Siroheme biosynthesis protein met8 [Psilocybe cubensis]KAH9484112.1 Siroheme biosynthesis protein met8 [Psilocybe cubensis]
MDNNDTRIKNLGGGSLLIAWQLKGKNVLIVGGGEVASQRIESILASDAFIHVLSPQNGLHPRTRQFIELRKDRITYHERCYSGPGELDDMDMVLTALDDNELSRSIVELSRQRRIPVNAADIPDLCDFYFGAQIRDGPLQIMISTNGNGPRIASLIKTRLQKGLSGLEGEAIIKVGQLRNKLKERAPGVGGQLGRDRMKWISSLCNKWEMEDFTLLDEAMMDRLLDEGWEQGKRVPEIKDLGIRPTGNNTHRCRLYNACSNSLVQTVIAFVAGAAMTTLLFRHVSKR